MKSYTDIGQSKKLAEILPLESADMCFANDGTSTKIDANPYNIRKLMWEDVQVIPCWSLSALLGLMPFQLIANNNRFGFYQVKGFNKQGETYRFGYKTNNNSFLFETSWYNDVIDAAFEMVVWLKEKRKVMIYEDYCSFEVYKLLKEKGFDGETHTTFDKEGYTQPSITHQMAMKWLRKEHNILLFLLPAQENGKLVYLVEVWTLNEEDERRAKDTIYFLDTAKKHYASTVELDACIDWFNFPKERYAWKPSDEQIKVCKEVCADILSAKGFDLGTVNSELNRMEEQLKKLKGE